MAIGFEKERLISLTCVTLAAVIACSVSAYQNARDGNLVVFVIVQVLALANSYFLFKNAKELKGYY